MKKLLLLALSLCSMAALALQSPVPALTPPASVTLTWTASASDTNALSPLQYVVEQGTSTGVYTTATNVGTNLTVTLTGVPRGTNYFWVVVALNTNSTLVSGFSNQTNSFQAAAPYAPALSALKTNSQ